MGDACEVHFRAEIQRQTSLDNAGRVLAESALALGWDLAAFHPDKNQLVLPRSDSGEFIATAMGWPDECVHGWVNLSIGRHCPVTQRCGTVADSFAWECDPRSVDWGDQSLTPEQSRALTHYGRFAAGAVTVPVRRAGGRTGYVSWFTRDRRALRRRYRATFSSTYVLSHAFIHHLDRLDEAQHHAANALTPRELECLSWAARGKTEEEIGIIIERSRETARFHLRNATAKLNASNRTHAVAIACCRGLIALV
jgi:DNA-binding CsgD family transcriptional regulator